MSGLRLALLVSVVLLAACQRSGLQFGLPAEEVLQQAGRASQTLESATFGGTVHLESTLDQTPLSEADVSVSGSFHHYAEQVHFTVTGDGALGDGDSLAKLQGELESIVASPEEVFLRIKRLNVKPADSFIRREIIAQLQNRWWQLPGNQTEGGQSVTPDPRLLRAQTQIVRVTQDHGIEEVGEGKAYHYSVEIDPEKLISHLQQVQVDGGAEVDEVALRDFLSRTTVTGELWIDTASFYPHEIRWHVQRGDSDDQSYYDLRFTIVFSDHNQAEPIAPPASAEPFVPLAVFDEAATPLLPSGMMDANVPALSPEAEADIVQKLLERTVPPSPQPE